MRTRAILLAMLAAALCAAASPVGAKLHTLYSFCAQSGCADGREPSAGLVADAAGNLYGTTLFGGDAGVGVVFELVRKGRKYRYRRLYSFCAQSGCADGSDAEAGLIVDTAGNLYGTTMAGGPNDGGVVYELRQKHGTWTYSVLYAFCALSDCTDGREPQAALTYSGEDSGLAYDGSSALYGTASQGGANKQGTAFALTPGAPLWNEQVLYAFCAQPGCTDGADPVAAIKLEGTGHILGTTYLGGATNMGTLFELVGPEESVLHSFCTSANCADGAFPASAVHFDLAGDIYGTTFGGGLKGKHCDDIGVAGCGTVYELSPSDHTLYDFCIKKNCSDGGYPLAGLVVDASTGTLWGATLYGGGHGDAPGAGTLFTFDGGERVLHRFCAKADCADGQGPEGDLLIDGAGDIFGTTLFAGANGTGGTVFELTPD